ncbi:DUF6230 family protein [Streptomyces mirabilis]|uniref:DUF6230 family protein n=1 Tax=Streptomyces mirabilis TaxID=68239 RepID=UPI0021C24F56|nr:DUF6230 family protein [Streptomyces mirabilis]MCT9111718.1 DUF6230 family protein [Streptomyces mirabilis]
MLHRAGRTSWKRFAAVLAPSVMAAAALGVGMAQGALAASFLISGQKFQVALDTLDVRGLSIYGMVDVTRKGTLVPVFVTGASRAEISGLCQSVVVSVPVLGPYTLRITGGDRRRVEAKNLFLDATSLSSTQANFDDLDIGVAAGAVSKGPINRGDRNSRFFDPNGFAQQADSAFLTNVHFTTVAVSAATFNVPDLDVRLRQGHHECF